ncbi:MAG: DUF4442 domain-containing protein [Flavobacterium sp.]
MNFTPSKLNLFLLFKLPAAFICGVRVKKISLTTCMVSVRHRWINQNPFGSLYFAVQAMAAELTTGALVKAHIDLVNKKISMLVVQNKSAFLKKALGKIVFECKEGNEISAILQKAIETSEGQTFWLKSIGKDESGEVVAEMDFEWSVKVKQS